MEASSAKRRGKFAKLKNRGKITITLHSRGMITIIHACIYNREWEIYSWMGQCVHDRNPS
jgi:hypothetical protein